MTVTVVSTIHGIGRWKPNARGRLEQAAMELYAKHGFEQTTVAGIAERAGLTERTFFRHYADKREVLFAGSEQLRDAIVAGVASAPESASPLDAIAAGLTVAAEALQERRDFARRRSRIIAANPELQEREVSKLVSWARALADALLARGVAEPVARLAGEIGIAVFRIAFESWTDEGATRAFPRVMNETLEQLTALAGAIQLAPETQTTQRLHTTSG
jgi:AcrR family transcriptional regulator